MYQCIKIGESRCEVFKACCLSPISSRGDRCLFLSLYPHYVLLPNDIESYRKSISPFHHHLCFRHAGLLAAEYWHHWWHDGGISNQHQGILLLHVHLCAGFGELWICLLCWSQYCLPLQCQCGSIPYCSGMVGFELRSSLAGVGCCSCGLRFSSYLVNPGEHFPNMPRRRPYQ